MTASTTKGTAKGKSSQSTTKPTVSVKNKTAKVVVKKTRTKKITNRVQPTADNESEEEVQSEDELVNSSFDASANLMEMADLRKRLEELETAKELSEAKAASLKQPRSLSMTREAEATPTARRNDLPIRRRINPADSKILGNYDGKSDLDAFLLKFERCSEYCDWTNTDRCFQLTNALVDSASYVVKELGPRGTVSEIIALLKTRFGNEQLVEKFKQELQTRKRRKGETLRELYLDLSRLKANAFGNADGEKYPPVFFRDVYVNALGDRELRKAVLIQKPMTMEAAYNVSCQLEAIDAYETPYNEGSRLRRRIQEIEVASPKMDSTTKDMRAMERELAELRDTVRLMQQTAREQQPVRTANPQQIHPAAANTNYVVNSTKLESTVNSSAHSRNDQCGPAGKSDVGSFPNQQCFRCGEVGHWSRECNLPKHRPYQATQVSKGNAFTAAKPSNVDLQPRGSGTNQYRNLNLPPRAEEDMKTGQQCHNYYRETTQSEVERTRAKPVKLRREAYLEINFRGKKIRALLDSGCEQSVIGRNLIPFDQLQPTQEKLNTADGSDFPLIGETVVELEISGFSTVAHVVVTEAMSDLILGIEWLQHNRCTWDFGSNSFKILGNQGNLCCKKEKHSIRRIFVREETTVPARHQGEIPVWVTWPTWEAEGEWILESKYIDPGLETASMIYGKRDIKAFCKVMNLSEHPKTFQMGWALGEAERIEIVGGNCTKPDGEQYRGKSMVADEGDSLQTPIDLSISNPRNNNMNNKDNKETNRDNALKVQREDRDIFTVTNSTNIEFNIIVQKMLDDITADISDQEREQVRQLIESNQGIFSTSEFDLGRTNLVKHVIDTGHNKPFRQQLRRQPLEYLPIIDEHVDKMLANGICEPSNSPWASNVVLVKKGDGSLRFCIDYRQLNLLTVKDSFPLPRIDTCFDALGGARYFSTLDLRQGYWQVENDPESAEKTTFITRKGAYKFNVLPFGLSNAPAVFQRLMNLVMVGLTWEQCLVFLDDILVISTTFKEHLQRLENVFWRLRSANLKLKPSKCCLFQVKVKFLGSVVSADGIEPDPDKVKAVADWPTPQNLTELRAFVGLANYYRRHVEEFSKIARPLTDLTKKNRPFSWNDEQQAAFEELKRRLINYPVLAPPMSGGYYVVDTDASNFAAGAVLQQYQNGILRVIAYVSRTFGPAEVQYCTTRKELAAVIFALREFRHYLLGVKEFTVRTDHGALTSLYKTPVPIQQNARYTNFLAEYNLKIEHRPGAQHGNSDRLSRRPCGSNKCNNDQCSVGFTSGIKPNKIGLGSIEQTDQEETVYENREQRPQEEIQTLLVDNLRSGREYLHGRRQPIVREKSDQVSEPTLCTNNEFGTQSGLSIEIIQTEQAKDPVLAKILAILPEKDTLKNVNHMGMDVVHLWGQRQSLVVKNGILCRKFESAEGLILHFQTLVPLSLRMKFLYWIHGDPTSGHFGIAKSVAKFEKYAYWSGWRHDVILFVRRCDLCCRYKKGPVKPQGLMQNGVGLAPFQKFHVDLTGPHRKSAKGNNYLLTGICCFTKYLIIVPLRDKTAISVARALVKHVYLIYGAVELIVHDNGGEFVNAIMENITKLMGIQDLRNTSLRPQANSQIERVHRTINSVLRRRSKKISPIGMIWHHTWHSPTTRPSTALLYSVHFIWYFYENRELVLT